VETGVQEIYKYGEKPDSGFRRNLQIVCQVYTIYPAGLRSLALSLSMKTTLTGYSEKTKKGRFHIFAALFLFDPGK
jgi:hypothetical protein